MAFGTAEKLEALLEGDKLNRESIRETMEYVKAVADDMVSLGDKHNKLVEKLYPNNPAVRTSLSDTAVRHIAVDLAIRGGSTFGASQTVKDADIIFKYIWDGKTPE